MVKWLIDYNTIFPHSSLGHKSPIEHAIMKDKKCQMLWMDTMSKIMGILVSNSGAFLEYILRKLKEICQS